MRAQGIRGATRAKKRFTTKADPAAVQAPDLVKRDFTASRPDATWVCDFTYSAQLTIMCSSTDHAQTSQWCSPLWTAHNHRPSRKARRRSPGWNLACAGLGSVTRRSTASLVARSASRY
jgi:hypothetical protein